MATRISFLRRFSLFCSLSICLITLPGFAQAQGTVAATEIPGEASVVLYDGFANGRPEITHYIIDGVKNRETRVFSATAYQGSLRSILPVIQTRRAI